MKKKIIVDTREWYEPNPDPQFPASSISIKPTWHPESVRARMEFYRLTEYFNAYRAGKLEWKYDEKISSNAEPWHRLGFRMQQFLLLYKIAVLSNLDGELPNEKGRYDIAGLFNARMPTAVENQEVVLQVYISSFGFHKALRLYWFLNSDPDDDKCARWLKLRQHIADKVEFVKHPRDEILDQQNLLATTLVCYLEDNEIGLFRRLHPDGNRLFWRRSIFGQNYRYDVKSKEFNTTLHSLGTPKRVWQIVPRHLTVQYGPMEITHGSDCTWDPLTNKVFY